MSDDTDTIDSSAMKKCPECGYKVKEFEYFCPKCEYNFVRKDFATYKKDGYFISELNILKDKISPRYDIVDFIGKGGFSTVFKLKDKSLNRLCALKIMSKELISEPQMVERFILEAKFYARLDHPNIVKIYDFGTHNEIAYIIMEYIDGVELKKYITKNFPIPIEKVVAISRDLSSVLEYIHAKGIIHRDIKPSNVMLQNSDGRAMLTDFGLAKSLGTTKFTATGRILGSPHYLSPEQARGDNVDIRTDIYSLGITLFELASGKVPYDGGTPVQIIFKHVKEKPPRPSKIYPEINSDFERIILKAIRKKPKDRYSNTTEILDDLNQMDYSPLKKGKAKLIRKIKHPVTLSVAAVIFLVAVMFLFKIMFPGSEPVSNKTATLQAQGNKQAVENLKKDVPKEVKKASVKKVTAPVKQKPIAKIDTIPLAINSNVKAKVFIDDRLYGIVPPGKRILLPAGQHRVMLVRSDKKFNKTEVRMVNLTKGNRSMSVNHHFETLATIQSINAVPWGRVFIDGQYKGITPIQNVKVLEGLHTIKIENPSFKTFLQNINVKGGQTITNIHAKLQRKEKDPSLD